jgi:ATP-dependent helicase/nuclease subunit A
VKNNFSCVTDFVTGRSETGETGIFQDFSNLTNAEFLKEVFQRVPEDTSRRIDRLVEFDDALWVLDYKSSGEDTPHLDAYRAQVTDYCAVVAAVFPGRRVHGALVFIGGSLLEVC